ncbi:MAG: FtsX-like permease family protein, partial [Candidatus Thorarchaeota archaeon]
MHRTKYKSLPQKGNRAYAFSYALSSMRAYPFRALSLALTLSLGVSLIASVMVWSDTGVHVSVDGYFESNSFQMMVHNPAGGTDEVNVAQAYIESDPLIESVHRTNSTVGIVWGTELPDSTLYGLDEPIYTEGMKDCEVIFVDNEFLSTTVPSFSIEGAFELQEGETLVSRQFVDYVHQLFGTTLTINSTLDIELLTIKSSYSPAPIGAMGRYSLSSLVIVGIYEIEGYGSLIETGFPSLMRSNYDFHHYDTPVLGIRDSIMVLSEFLPVEDVSEVGFFGPRAFIRASGDNLIAAGTDRIADNLLTLKARVDEQYDVVVDGLGEILELQGIVDTYVETMPLALLNLPIFILALFLSVFAADTFMAARKTEVSALRSKGASSNQIYSIFLSESVVMATLSIILGMVLSVLFAALIPSTVSFMLFDWELYAFYLQATVLKPETFATSILITILPPLLFILGSAKRAAGTEIGSHLIDVSEPLSTEPESIGFTVGISVVLLSIVLGAVLFLPNDPFLLLLELGLGTAAWFFLAYNGSRFSRRSFARIFEKASFLVGEKNLISASNLKMRKGRIVPLMV